MILCIVDMSNVVLLYVYYVLQVSCNYALRVARYHE